MSFTIRNPKLGTITVPDTTLATIDLSFRRPPSDNQTDPVAKIRTLLRNKKMRSVGNGVYRVTGWALLIEGGELKEAVRLPELSEYARQEMMRSCGVDTRTVSDTFAQDMCLGMRRTRTSQTLTPVTTGQFIDNAGRRYFLTENGEVVTTVVKITPP